MFKFYKQSSKEKTDSYLAKNENTENKKFMEQSDSKLQENRNSYKSTMESNNAKNLRYINVIRMKKKLENQNTE